MGLYLQVYWHEFLYSNTSSSFFVLVALQKGNKVLIQLEIKAAKVNGGTVGKVAVVDCITTDRAVKVNCSTIERQ